MDKGVWGEGSMGVGVGAYHELFDSEGEGGGVEKYLLVVGETGDDVVEHTLEVLRE